MTIQEFDKKYKKNGGIKQLTLMREKLETLEKISNKFGVCKERVRQWMTDLFDEKYDPRNERRKRKIEVIKKLIQKHGVEKTKALYSGLNKSYLKEAIKELN